MLNCILVALNAVSMFASTHSPFSIASTVDYSGRILFTIFRSFRILKAKEENSYQM